jgi:hypothetical protein
MFKVRLVQSGRLVERGSKGHGFQGVSGLGSLEEPHIPGVRPQQFMAARELCGTGVAHKLT